MLGINYDSEISPHSYDCEISGVPIKATYDSSGIYIQNKNDINAFVYDGYTYKRETLNFAKEQKMNEIDKAKIGKELLKDLPLINREDVNSLVGGHIGMDQFVDLVNKNFKQRVAELKVELPKMPTIYVYENDSGEVELTHVKDDIPRSPPYRLTNIINNYIPEPVPQEPTPDKLSVTKDDLLKAKDILVRAIENGVSL